MMKVMSKKTFLYAAFILIALSGACKAREPIVIPLPEPEAAVAPSNPIPDVIRIAIYFVEREGMDDLLVIEKARVKTQDREAYYISFPRKSSANTGDFVVKVYKRNGWTEWSY